MDPVALDPSPSNKYVLYDWQRSWMGPHWYGSSIYAVVADYSVTVGGNHPVVVLKSNDLGATWSEVDAANHKIAKDDGTTAACYRDGDVLYILYAAPLACIARFDLATDQWLSDAETGGPNISGMDGGTCLVRRSDGSFVITYSTYEDWYNVARYCVASGGWGVPQYSMGHEAGVDQLGISCILGSADRVHIIAGTRSGLSDWLIHVCTLTLAGVLNIFETTADCSNYFNTPTVGAACTFTVGSDRWIAISYGTLAPSVMRFKSVDAVSAVYVDTLVENPPDPVSANRSSPGIMMPTTGIVGTLFLENSLLPWYGSWAAPAANKLCCAWIDYDGAIHLVGYSGTGAEAYNNSAGWTTPELPSGTIVYTPPPSFTKGEQSLWLAEVEIPTAGGGTFAYFGSPSAGISKSTSGHGWFT